MYGGGKRLIYPFRRQELWQFIAFVLLAVTYGNKVHKLWSEIPKYFCRTASTKLLIDVLVNANLYELCCDHYNPFYVYACH